MAEISELQRRINEEFSKRRRISPERQSKIRAKALRNAERVKKAAKLHDRAMRQEMLRREYEKAGRVREERR